MAKMFTAALLTVHCLLAQLMLALRSESNRFCDLHGKAQHLDSTEVCCFQPAWRPADEVAEVQLITSQSLGKPGLLAGLQGHSDGS